ncbi:hypothetical protein [Streptomyces sp. YS-3]|uniref:hypothetical protein n=1 Tax=Streptomyces sp. YS-3 TaxID=3381352 RepID=UPI003862611B
MTDERGAALGQMQAGTNALLMGRVACETLAAVWPHQTGPMAEALNGVRKRVVSPTLAKTEWSNSPVIDGDVLTDPLDGWAVSQDHPPHATRHLHSQ